MRKELDLRGLRCPEPVIRCRSLLKEERPEELIVIVDNAAASENVSRFLERNNYAAAAGRISDSEWRVSAARSGEAPAPSRCAAAEPPSGKTLVLLTSDTIGRGDDLLGSKLMNMFLANLSELGDSLWRIILLNGAVRLCAREGEALESLKALAASGAGVFVCGTCLSHYGLLEKKAVGETTNMMDVISSMALAQKIIRP